MVNIYPTVHPSVLSTSFLSIKPTQWMLSYLSTQPYLHLALCVLNHSFTFPPHLPAQVSVHLLHYH